jgi:hypothetical protein
MDSEKAKMANGLIFEVGVVEGEYSSFSAVSTLPSSVAMITSLDE